MEERKIKEKSLKSRIEAFISEPPPRKMSIDNAFNELALGLFDFQYHYNDAYCRYCKLLGIQPGKISSWEDIPAVSSLSFKHAQLRSFPEKEINETFFSSGTSIGHSGRHLFNNLDLYHLSLKTFFKTILNNSLPTHSKIRFLILSPPLHEFQGSSLVNMFQALKETYGTSQSKFYIHHNHLEAEALAEDLRLIERLEEPTMLMGTAFSYVHFMDYLSEAKTSGRHRVFNLPKGSLLLETGGFKGKSREIEVSEFYTLLSEYFSIPMKQIISEYGMSELSSQCYDVQLINDQNFSDHGFPRLKAAPHWCRLKFVGENPIEPDKQLIQFFDLANLNSVSSILTEDLGKEFNPITHQGRVLQTFKLYGRAPKAEMKGCSLSFDMLLG